MKKNNYTIQTKEWTFILYGDETPYGSQYEKAIEWNENRLRPAGVRFAISPLHKPESKTGQEKKPHYHIILQFGARQSEKQVNKLLDDLQPLNEEGKRPNITKPMKVDSLPELAQYLIHMKDSDKEQFTDEAKIKCMKDSTIDLELYFNEITPQQKKMIFQELCRYIIDGKCTNLITMGRELKDTYKLYSVYCDNLPKLAILCREQAQLQAKEQERERERQDKLKSIEQCQNLYTNMRKPFNIF